MRKCLVCDLNWPESTSFRKIRRTKSERPSPAGWGRWAWVKLRKSWEIDTVKNERYLSQSQLEIVSGNGITDSNQKTTNASGEVQTNFAYKEGKCRRTSHSTAAMIFICSCPTQVALRRP